MVLLKDILDVELLGKHIKNGMVSRRYHDSLPLAILNYTAECQYSRAWDDVTRKTRGLIYNTQSLEVVARPFEKFFNWDEAGSQYPPSGPCLQMPKMDGSLGILYSCDGRKFGIATRGSLHSEQAEWATKFFNREVMLNMEFFFAPKPDKTYLFEIVYPENRIVVDYGDYKGLILIDVIDNETGFADTDEFDNCGWSDKVVRKPLPGFEVQQINDVPDGDEGFVYLWPTRNFRTKMKSAQYVILHRLISNLSEKTIWQQLCEGRTLDDIKKDLPEEFHGFVDEKGKEITDNATAITAAAIMRFKEIVRGLPEEFSRGDFAKEASKSHMSKYLFLMLDGKAVYPVALKDSKPTRETKMAGGIDA